MANLKLTLLSNYDTPDYAYGVTTKNAVAYVADGLSGLQLIDISDPAHPTKLGTYNTSGSAANVVVVGSIAYVADGSGGLQIIDVSNAQQPQLLSTYDTANYTAAVTVLGNIAYIADESGGLQVLDVSNPSQPSLLSSYSTVGSVEGVTVVGSIAFIADWGAGLELIDVSNPQQPVALSRYDTEGTAAGVTVVGNIAYVADGSSGLQLIDISNPYRPILRSSYNTQGSAQSVTVLDNKAYIADYDKGLVILDVSNPDQPAPLANYNTAGFAFSTAVASDMAYLADEEHGLQIFQVASTAPPYTISLDSSQVDEGDTAYFRLTTTNVPNNTEVPFTLSGTISAADAAGGELPITNFYVWNNTATVAIGFVQDKLTEGVETLTATLANGKTATVTVNDTSIPPVSVNHLGTVNIDDSTPTDGQKLTATVQDADGMPNTISYQWLAGTTAIGTNSATYTVTTADIGKTISVTANYTDNGNTKETVSSSATATVVKAIGDHINIETPTGFVTHEDDSTTQSQTPLLVSLNTQPFRDVTVKFSSTDKSEGVLDNATLTFTPSNWNVKQTTIVHGVNDYLDDNDVTYSIKGIVDTLDVKYARVAIDPMPFVNIGDKNELGFDRDVPLQSYDSLNYIYDMALFPRYGDSGNGDAQGPAIKDILVGMDGADKLYGYGKQDDISGGIGDDSLYGGNDNDFLYGEAGNDWLYGEQDNDRLDGGIGNDSVDGGLGIDTMIGGEGNDTYYLGYDAADVIDDQGLATDIDTIIMPYQLVSYKLPNGIENASIASGDNGILLGNQGNNKLTGNEGGNKLAGGAGNDSLIGGLGSDTLNGGAGKDQMTGGTGKDNFIFSTPLKANTDTITDFKVIDDTIQLDDSTFTTLTHKGVLNTNALQIGTTALDSTDKIIYNKTTGALYYDDDGNGAHAAVQIAVLGVNLALTAADFVVI